MSSEMVCFVPLCAAAQIRQVKKREVKSDNPYLVLPGLIVAKPIVLPSLQFCQAFSFGNLSSGAAGKVDLTVETKAVCELGGCRLSRTCPAPTGVAELPMVRMHHDAAYGGRCEVFNEGVIIVDHPGHPRYRQLSSKWHCHVMLPGVVVST